MICSSVNETSRLQDELRATGEGDVPSSTKRDVGSTCFIKQALPNHCEVPKLKLVNRRLGTDNLKSAIEHTSSLKKVGTWNIRSMMQKGKLENVKREMKRYGLNVLGLSEVRWKESGDFMSDDVRVIYSGGQQ